MAREQSLRSMKLIHYKGFERYSINLTRTSVLVGANNAGKTTALGALRLIAAMLPQARRTNPTALGELDGRPLRGWPITGAAIEASAFAAENIRYDFRPLEARVEVTASSGTRLVAAWSVDDVHGPTSKGMYYVLPPDAKTIVSPRTAARELVPSIGVVPTLSPLDDREKHIMDETHRKNLTSRRTSRYFRNALWRLSPAEWDEFRDFVFDRTPEIASLSIHRAQDTVEDDFDLFYTESGLRHEREIVWAGDGIQIWLQALYHIWRQRDAPVMILDEPDVFLHPDLQRRLARALFSSSSQVIVATHSLEILAEADPGSAIWVDRSRRRAERPRSDGALAMLGRRLGSGYELGVARALRSNAVLFVEGDDAPVIALIAASIGRQVIASSEAYATVPLGGFSRNSVAGAFAETMAALGGDIRTFVLLDSDLRCKEALTQVETPLRRAGAKVHIWTRRELENYVLHPAPIAKVSGIDVGAARIMLTEVVRELEDEARLTLQTRRMDEHKEKVGPAAAWSSKTVLANASKEFKVLWSTEEGRLSVVDAKLAMSMLNTRLSAEKKKTINLNKLAKAVTSRDLPQEMLSLFERMEDFILGR